MKFKIGQKIRIKKWLDMPQCLQEKWGEPAFIGKVGEVLKENNIESTNGYDVCFPEKKGNLKNTPPAFYFPQELEPLVKIGEQLLFSFME